MFNCLAVFARFWAVPLRFRAFMFSICWNGCKCVCGYFSSTGIWPLRIGSPTYDNMLVLTFVGQTRWDWYSYYKPFFVQWLSGWMLILIPGVRGLESLLKTLHWQWEVYDFHDQTNCLLVSTFQLILLCWLPSLVIVWPGPVMLQLLVGAHFPCQPQTLEFSFGKYSLCEVFVCPQVSTKSLSSGLIPSVGRFRVIVSAI